MMISDMGDRRCWKLDNVFEDYRSSQSPLNIQVPANRKWECNMGSQLTCNIRQKRPTNPGSYGDVEIAIELTWYLRYSSIARNEAKSYVRVTTRAPPSKGRWREIDCDPALLGRFEPCAEGTRDVKYSSHQVHDQIGQDKRPAPATSPLRDPKTYHESARESQSDAIDAYWDPLHDIESDGACDRAIESDPAPTISPKPIVHPPGDFPRDPPPKPHVAIGPHPLKRKMEKEKITHATPSTFLITSPPPR